MPWGLKFRRTFISSFPLLLDLAGSNLVQTCFRCRHAWQQEDRSIMTDISKNRCNFSIGLRFCDLEDFTL